MGFDITDKMSESLHSTGAFIGDGFYSFMDGATELTYQAAQDPTSTTLILIGSTLLSKPIYKALKKSPILVGFGMVFGSKALEMSKKIIDGPGYNHMSLYDRS